MAAVFAPTSRVAAVVKELNAATDGPGLSVAADNGAHQVVSGPKADVEALLARFDAEEVRVARLRKSPAYHSAMIEPALGDLEAAISTIAFQPPSLTFVSNLTGRTLEPGEAPDAAYWRRQAREPVAFRACIETLAEQGVNAVIEIGPHAVLGPMTTMAWPEAAGRAPVVLSSLVRPAKDEEPPAPGSGGGFVEAVARAYEAGLPLRFDGLFAGEARRRIALPGYPFQRERHWVEAPKRRRQASDHPLLGSRHEAASGEIAFDTEIFPSDPAWLTDHRVFGRLVAPGALYGAMAAAASLAEGSEAVVVDDFQIQSPLVLPEEEAQEGSASAAGRRVQVLLEGGGKAASRRVQVLSRGEADEGWTLHAEGRILSSPGGPAPETASPIDSEGVKAALAPVDLSGYYRAKAEVGIDFGPSFRTLEEVRCGPGEALGEVCLPAGLGGSGLDIHPLLLDGCFQAVAAARDPDGAGGGTTYLPLGWERLWLRDGLTDQLICHVRMREGARDAVATAEPGKATEVLSADLQLYDRDGGLIGELAGYTLKRATRAALLAAVEGVDELLYEMVWRDCALPPGMPPADFLAGTADIAATVGPFTDYLAAEGVAAEERAALLADLERLSRSYALQALERLGWERVTGASVDPEALRRRLSVADEHEHLFCRLLEMIARSGVLSEEGGGFVVEIGGTDALPDDLAADPEILADRMAAQHAHGSSEFGLFRRCAGALADVLRGRADPLALLFSGEPSAAEYYRMAPAARAANRLLADAVATLVRDVPDERRLRVLEVGAGTGSATASVLPALPAGRFDYTYTDISAGFFADAESRFGEREASIDYRVLDIEKDPVAQEFAPHCYDLVIAANVLHATRDLGETLAHCRTLLAPSGQLLALENQRAQSWLDLTFGQLDGWWRFADAYRPHHALASPAVWRRVLGDTSFEDVAMLGVDESDSAGPPDRGVILARGPATVAPPQGLWVLAADSGGVAAALAARLAARNQRVVLAGADDSPSEDPAEEGAAIRRRVVDMDRREAWRALFDGLRRTSGRSASRCRASCRAGRPRRAGHDRRPGGGYATSGGERARAGAGHRGRRCGAREGRLVRNPRRRRC